jgi:hypothetical protein
VPERATHDYKRSGTSSLYAALDITTGKVIGSLHSRHRAIEFKKFLQRLDREVPADLEVHLVLDRDLEREAPTLRLGQDRRGDPRLGLSLLHSNK